MGRPGATRHREVSLISGEITLPGRPAVRRRRRGDLVEKTRLSSGGAVTAGLPGECDMQQKSPVRAPAQPLLAVADVPAYLSRLAYPAAG